MKLSTEGKDRIELAIKQGIRDQSRGTLVINAISIIFQDVKTII